MTANSTFAVFLAVLRRDLLIGLRHRSELFNPLVFFFIVVTMFVLALGPYADTLKQVAPAVIWVAALLASTLSLDMLFHSDLDDGFPDVIESHISFGTVLAVSLGSIAHGIKTSLLIQEDGFDPYYSDISDLTVLEVLDFQGSADVSFDA